MLSSHEMTSPVRHGVYHLVPEGWEGPLEQSHYHPPPDDVAIQPQHGQGHHPFWREPTVPPGWTFAGESWGQHTDPPFGYVAGYHNQEGFLAVEVIVLYAHERPLTLRAFGPNRSYVREARIVDGHHTLVTYSPPGPHHLRLGLTEVSIFDETTGMQYVVTGFDRTLLGANIEPVIEIARSLLPSAE